MILIEKLKGFIKRWRLDRDFKKLQDLNKFDIHSLNVIIAKLKTVNLYQDWTGIYFDGSFHSLSELCSNLEYVVDRYSSYRNVVVNIPRPDSATSLNKYIHKPIGSRPYTQDDLISLLEGLEYALSLFDWDLDVALNNGFIYRALTEVNDLLVGIEEL